MCLLHTLIYMHTYSENEEKAQEKRREESRGGLGREERGEEEFLSFPV